MKPIISNIVQRDQRFKELSEVFSQKNLLITGLNPSAKAVMMAEQYLAHDRQMVIITNNLYQAERLENDLGQLIPADELYKYSVQDIMIEEFSTKSPDLMSERIRTLTRLSNDSKGLFIIPINGLKKLLSPKELFKVHVIQLQLSMDIELEAFQQQLVDMGYIRRNQVTTVGEFSVRGGLIDVFPMIGRPIRIELFDTEIDSIRYFDADTQRSEENVERVEITAASEFIFNDEQIERIRTGLKAALDETEKKLSKEAKQDLHETYDNLISHSAELLDHNILRRAIKFAYPEETTIVDYLMPNALVVVDEYNRVKEAEQSMTREIEEFQQSLIESGRGFIGQRFINDDAFHQLLNHFTTTFFTLFTATMPVKIEEIVKFSCKPVQQFYGQYDLMFSEFDRFRKQDYTMVVLASNPTRKKKIQDMLLDMQLPVAVERTAEPGIAIITSGDLSEGFELPYMKLAVITERELFKLRKEKPRRNQKKLSNAEKIKSYQELNVGDYVVHIYHGVGRYLGVETLEVNQIHKDYIKIQYKGTDQLFVPVDQMSYVQKFVGSEDKEPKLNKMGGTEWKKTKAKVQQSVNDIADELLKLYQERERVAGYQFGPDTEEQNTFEMDFPYEPTEDQVRSLEEIKEDMEKVKPMDRLLCGDVGYGKTEVAVRAAFKAVMDGKQVAFLVPTTILAQQHYETILERMQDYAVEIQMMSRFRTAKEIKATKEGLKSGFVDIVVGTHKLLSKDVIYKDLGLLIVDEEQRFGVTHKEKIKALKTNVDVLTLTATPIPRTLHMSLLGVRDLSVIETPPENRFPVQTYVLEYQHNFIKEAIERELARNGQVFYLYNRVSTIYQKAEQLQTMLPEANIAVAHGQMSERELEETMLGFINGEYDVLVTTTIIETGVDVPNANTLIIEDADRFGLSQLYQLRGRVGRSNRISYAYFLHAPNKVLTEVAEQRLQAIKEFTELGSGFKIAMRDLNIRGAGNLLGRQQHGFIDSVGYDLYSEMLQQAVNEKRGIEPEQRRPEIEVDVQVDAYIPAEYIREEQAKIEFYKKLRHIQTEQELLDVMDEMTDRYGDYPIEVERLLNIVKVKINAFQLGITNVKEKPKEIEITVSAASTARINGEKLFKDSESFGRDLKVGVTDNQMLLSLKKRGNWLQSLVQLTDVMQGSIEINGEE
ncbi:transcription-repair coupling factor [Macrococcus hajekii]|uniref:Transcription-repair-coupling factor n=1 Tax=Macrococcus hajekii TaxID=198482 RepID=A0A4V3BDR8_9STAP|nr:transcription-repair coupling factor [Macrococcus hajekii]TDM01037.1 transcription-repair coupling factor [Macrococcus hajekii]GGB12892.1 transcription-repair-coupling factor [Macrococcus hajekii]